MSSKRILEEALRKAGIDATVVNASEPQVEKAAEVVVKTIAVLAADCVSVSVISNLDEVTAVAISSSEDFIALEGESATKFLSMMRTYFAAKDAK